MRKRLVLLGLLLLALAIPAHATTLTITGGGWDMSLDGENDGGFISLPGQTFVYGFTGEGFEISTLGGISGNQWFAFDLTLDGVYYPAPCERWIFCTNLEGSPSGAVTGLTVLDPQSQPVHFDLTGTTVITIFCHVDGEQPGDRCHDPDVWPLPWFSVRYVPAAVPEPATLGLVGLGLGLVGWARWRRCA